MIKKIDKSIEILGGSNAIEVRYRPSYLEARKLIEIQKGVLRLKVNVVNGYSGVYTFTYTNKNNEVKVIDKLNSVTASGYLNIEISDELQEMLEGESEYLSIKLEGVSLSNINVLDSEIRVKYESKSAMLLRGAMDNISASKAGVSTIDLTSKNHIHEHNDLTLSSNNEFNLMHVYNSQIKENENSEVVVYDKGVKRLENLYHNGNGWKLNVEQYLYEDLNEESEDKYVYIDELSRHIEFKEKYTYKDNEEEIEVKESEVKLKADGSLYETKTGNENEVKKRLESESHLELITSLEDIKNSHVINAKGEELTRLELEKEQLETSIEALEDNIKNNNNQIISCAIARKIKELEAIVKQDNTTINEDYLRTSELLYKIQRKYFTLTRESEYLLGKEISEEDLEKIEGFPAYQETGLTTETINKIREEISQEIGYLLTIGTNNLRGNIQISKNSQLFDELIYKDETEAKLRNSILSQIAASIPNVDIAIKDLINEHVQGETSIAKLQEQEIGLQMKLLYESGLHLVKQLESMNKQLDKKKAEIELLENTTPKHYIKDTNNNILGFGKTKEEGLYRLVLVMDENNKVTYINYTNDKVVSIVDETGLGITLEYKENKLSKITNKEGRKIRYEYVGENLARIRYGNNSSSEYIYNEKGDLTSIVSPSGYGIELEVNNGKVSKIKKISYVEKIDETGVSKKAKESLKEEKIEYKSKRSISVVNEYEDRVRNYILDKQGYIESIYNNNLIKDNQISTVEILTHKKVGKRKSLDIISKKKSEELVEVEVSDSASEYYLGEESILGQIELVSVPSLIKSKVYKITASNPKFEVELTSRVLEKIKSSKNKQYVLSGWAKADSGYVARDYIGYNEELDIDEIESLLEESYFETRRFELKAELTYANGEKKEVYTSYDCRNKEWQYNALGVTIENKESLAGIKLYFDYTNNIGEAEFTSISFKEGEYEYKEYNEEDLLSYLENKDYKEEYEYEDRKLVKKTRYKEEKEEYSIYEYNNLANLVRIETSDKLVKENEYDENGKLKATYVYHKENPSIKIYEYEKGEKEGKEYQINPLGKVLAEYKNTSNGLTIGEFSYGYDQEGNLASISLASDNNKIVYHEGLMVKQSHNDTDYSYTYNNKLELSKIKINNRDYLDLTYQDLVDNNIKVGSKQSSTYLNGDSYIKEYDKENRLIKTSYSKEGVTTSLLENTYNLLGELLVNKDSLTNGEHLYNYDNEGRVTKISYTGENLDNNVEYTYSEKGQLIKEEFTYLDTNKEKTYTYDNKNRVKEINIGNGLVKTITYDELDRVIKVEYQDKYIIEYEYLTIKDHTTSLINKETLIRNNKVETITRYEYDDKLNLRNVIENTELMTRYSYDNLNRLVREDNKKLNKSIVYSYNKGGNIENKLEYPFSLEDLSLLSKLDNHTYSYTSSLNKDMLTSYDGINFEYDSLFRPTLYKNKVVEWSKNNMSRYDNVNYTYTGSGLRHTKQVNNVTTKYYYQGNKLKLEDNGNKLVYHYDDKGVIGFTYLGVGDYYFIKNIQGDIISIIDSNNVEIVKYVYEGYGNHKTYVLNNGEYVDSESHLTYTEDGANNKMLAKINPFRYRGYYYDADTGLYYLLTRYYDPSLSRFMSVDSLEYLDNSSLNGLNLYAYCLNNPIMNVDSFGCSAWSDFWNSTGGKILGTVLTVSGVIALTIATAGVGAAVATSLGGGFWASVAGSALGGAVSGAIFGAGVSIATQGVSKGYTNISFQTVAVDTAVSAAIGGVVGGLFYIGGHYSRHLTKYYPFNRTVQKSRNSINFMFGEGNNFTIVKLGHLFRLESSARYGFHVHWISTKHRQLASIGVSAVVGGTIGTWINQLFD